VFGYASAVVFPALTLLSGLGRFEWEPWTAAVGVLVAALYATDGVITGLVSRRR